MTERSQNGWSVIQDTFLKQWNINGRIVPLRRGPAGYVLAHLLTKFDKEIESLQPASDDWGWALRHISGSDEWSNHASGTAVDPNSLSHPQGREGTFTPQQADDIHHMLEHRYDGFIRWGGDYRGTKDEMHFEINGTYSQIRTLAGKLANSAIGRQMERDN